MISVKYNFVLQGEFFVFDEDGMLIAPPTKLDATPIKLGFFGAVEQELMAKRTALLGQYAPPQSLDVPLTGSSEPIPEQQIPASGAESPVPLEP